MGGLSSSRLVDAFWLYPTLTLSPAFGWGWDGWKWWAKWGWVIRTNPSVQFCWHGWARPIFWWMTKDGLNVDWWWSSCVGDYIMFVGIHYISPPLIIREAKLEPMNELKNPPFGIFFCDSSLFFRWMLLDKWTYEPGCSYFMSFISSFSSYDPHFLAFGIHIICKPLYLLITVQTFSSSHHLQTFQSDHHLQAFQSDHHFQASKLLSHLHKFNQSSTSTSHLCFQDQARKMKFIIIFFSLFLAVLAAPAIPKFQRGVYITIQKSPGDKNSGVIFRAPFGKLSAVNHCKSSPS